MAHITQDELKTLFESGDLPTQADFVDLIDTLESNSEVKTVTINYTGIPTTIEAAFNATTTIVLTTKQAYVVIYDNGYYLFNAVTGTYGLGGTPTIAGNFIQVSAAVDNTTLPVVEIEIYSGLPQGTVLNLTSLITQINASSGFTHSTNTITQINYKSVYSNVTSLNYLVNGAPDDYGFGGTTVDASNFIQISRDKYYTTNAIRQISVVGTGNVWTDFNLTEVEIIAPLPMSEILVVLHNNVTYLFNPSIENDGSAIAYGLNQTPTNSTHFIGISASANPTIDIIRQNVDIVSAAAQGTPITKTQLVIDVNNGSTEIIQADNTINIINHKGVYANTSSANYLFVGPNATYGNGQSPVTIDDFVLLGQDDYQRTNTGVRIAVGGAGNVWDDFNTNVSLLIVDSLVTSEIYIIEHNSKTYLFNPDILPDGESLFYGNTGTSTATTSNFILLSDDSWIGNLPTFNNWSRSDDRYIETANVTRATQDGISGVLYSSDDINYSAKMKMRGYIRMAGIRAAGDLLVTIVYASYNCTNTKLVYLSDIANDAMYLCKWDTTGLYAAETIPDLVTLDLDSHYYYDNSYDIVAGS